jgi:uncharacterized protein YgiM (DUF1202 family)
MANKKGRSEKKTNWLGKSYIQHYDSKGNKSGRSERKETFFGKKYSQHTNARGEKTGRSEKKETWTGREYTQKYNAGGDKSGRSEKKEGWRGNKYTQHYDSKGNKTDWTERKEGWLGGKYVQRYGEDSGKRANASGSAGPSTNVRTGGDYSAARTSSYVPSARSAPSLSASPSSRSTRPFLIAVAIFGALALLVLLSLGTKNHSLVRSNDGPSSLGNAYVNTLQLNLRSGPGTDYGVIRRLSRGDYVACVEKTRNQHGELWVKVRINSYEGWVNQTLLSNDRPAPRDTPTPELASASPPSELASSTQVKETAESIQDNRSNPLILPVLKLSSLRFFESGYNLSPYGQRIYGIRFSGSAITYLGWELNLEHEPPNSRYQFVVKAVWRNPDGSILAQQTLQTYIESDWTTSHHGTGWGFKSPGTWKAGTYSVDVYIEDRKFASGSFEVY